MRLYGWLSHCEDSFPIAGIVVPSKEIDDKNDSLLRHIQLHIYLLKDV